MPCERHNWPKRARCPSCVEERQRLREADGYSRRGGPRGPRRPTWTDLADGVAKVAEQPANADNRAELLRIADELRKIGRWSLRVGVRTRKTR